MAGIIGFGSWSREGDEDGAVSALQFLAKEISGKSIGSTTIAMALALS